MVQDTGNRLISALKKQTEKINYFCEAENISPNLTVHEIRKAYKRLRALIQFFEECNNSTAGELKYSIKAAGKVLSPMRESFVNMQYFDKITAGSNLIADRKIRQVKDLLAEKNSKWIDDEFLGKDVATDIIFIVKNFQAKLNELKANCPSVAQLKIQLISSFSLGYEIYKTIEPDFLPEVMHELRKTLKQLWYQLEFIKFMHPRYFRMKSDQLNKITEQLGIDHDLHVFLEDLKSGNFDFSSDEILIFENQVEHQRELNRLKLVPRLKQFFNETPDMFNQKMNKIFRVDKS